jgi:AcrR family transcriptional regulator
MPPDPRSQKKQRILTAARDVCNEKGFESTRMDEIAHRAGVSKGTLYNFFSSKEDLFISAVLASYQRFDGLLPVVEDQSAEPAERLQALVESLAGGFGEISAQILLAHQSWSVVLRSPDARQRLFGTLRQIYAGYSAGLEDILSAGIASGSFRPDLDVELVTASWIAIFDGLLYRAGFEDPEAIQPCTADGVRACLGWMMDRITNVSETPGPDPYPATSPPRDAPTEGRAP